MLTEEANKIAFDLMREGRLVELIRDVLEREIGIADPAKCEGDERIIHDGDVVWIEQAARIPAYIYDGVPPLEEQTEEICAILYGCEYELEHADACAVMFELVQMILAEFYPNVDVEAESEMVGSDEFQDVLNISW